VKATVTRLLLAGLFLSGLAVAPSGSVYDALGRRQGYVRESRPGQYDLHDAHSRRLGYEHQGADGWIEFFDTHSWRWFEIRPERPGPQRGP
jgi:hypothetical protein